MVSKLLSVGAPTRIVYQRRQVPAHRRTAAGTYVLDYARASFPERCNQMSP